MALVGESGSGKTTTARCVAGLHHQYTGEVQLDGVKLGQAARARTADARKRIQYVFQNPYASLNPRRTIGQILARQLHLFPPEGGTSRATIGTKVAETLERVALSRDAASRYPDQLSGGERQRVAVARALAAEPSLLVCDEITSALDVSVQAAIVELLRDLREQTGLSLLFITHNLALIRTIADKVIVMTEGRIVEYGDTLDVFQRPQAEYTQRLLANTPTVENALGSSERELASRAREHRGVHHLCDHRRRRHDLALGPGAGDARADRRVRDRRGARGRGRRPHPRP